VRETNWRGLWSSRTGAVVEWAQSEAIFDRLSGDLWKVFVWLG
jgi:hypothetical protein